MWTCYYSAHFLKWQLHPSYLCQDTNNYCIFLSPLVGLKQKLFFLFWQKTKFHIQRHNGRGQTSIMSWPQADSGEDGGSRWGAAPHHLLPSELPAPLPSFLPILLPPASLSSLPWYWGPLGFTCSHSRLKGLQGCWPHFWMKSCPSTWWERRKELLSPVTCKAHFRHNFLI